ncbi:3-oxoacyl-ACP reductase FabG [Streptomyces marianii]|uniref:3-oxoacyl-ACP reductase FabG n=1 Tax=Streptomyces marianii TaxID=1817406 RepID=UPI001F26BCD3|nr:3-oxoacyl-ACP reductase FabG [Streptomyces marianii]
MDERIAVVTGAAGGIGSATARYLARAGAAVALIDVKAESITGLAAEITAAGGRALPVRCDVTDPTQVTAMVRTVAREFGAPHILVNNAGVLRDGALHLMSETDWDAVHSVNLRGAFLCARAVYKHMARARWGRVLNLSSVFALGSVGQVNYATAQAGLEGMTRALAVELGPFGITVNAVAPGLIETPPAEGADGLMGADGVRSALVADTAPLRRTGRPEDVAATLAFLAGDGASYITGQTIHVDGGLPLGRLPLNVCGVGN